MKRCVALVPMVLAGLVAPGCSAEADADRFATEALFPNDVSVLFPLPTAAEKDVLLAPGSAGAKGELLPIDALRQIPRLVAEGAARDDLRVVSARFDPCFPAVAGLPADPPGCNNQIRLVFQPIDAKTATTGETVSAKDAAIHAFYTMSREELAVLVKEIVAAKHGIPSSRSTTLGANPLIEEQGLGGTFATELRGIILEHAGTQNLTRVTFFIREPIERPSWTFGGFDIVGTTFTRMKIATLGEATQQTFTTFRRNGAALPAPRAADDISLLFLASVASAAPDSEIAKAYTAALRIQNPSMHSPNTMDCVSCHTATSARIWAETNEKQRSAGNPAAFVSRWDVGLKRSPASARPDNLHSFGYLGRDVSISQRTANESALVADTINEKLLGPF